MRRTGEQGFLARLFERGGETVGVFRPEVGENHRVGVDDFGQRLHLAGVRHPGFDDGHVGLGRHFPQRQRHADARVVGARRPRHGTGGLQHLEQPLFDGGLSGRAGYGHYLGGARREPPGHLLQRPHGVGNHEEVGVADTLHLLRHAVYYEIPHPRVVKLPHVAVAVVLLGGDGEEERSAWKSEGTRVGKQRVDAVVAHRAGKSQRPGDG